MKEKSSAYRLAFGKHLKQVIDQKSMTIAELASASGLQLKQVYRVINGEHSPTLSTIYCPAAAISVEPKVLFDFIFSMDMTVKESAHKSRRNSIKTKA